MSEAVVDAPGGISYCQGHEDGGEDALCQHVVLFMMR